MAKTLQAIDLIYLREGPYSVNKSEPDLDAIRSTSQIINLFCFRGERKKKQVKHLDGFEPRPPSGSMLPPPQPKFEKVIDGPQGRWVDTRDYQTFYLCPKRFDCPVVKEVHRV